jgi:glyoxylase-like metal-dependent hydrolase (beta-lactamase superfamily II)
MDDSGHGGPANVVCHCLLIETQAGLVLVDTGLGLRDVTHGHRRLSPLFTGLMRPQLRRAETAREQVRWLGFEPRDVRHIVLTHLDFDHAGGLEDFPHATVHVFGDEERAAGRRDTPVARGRYRPGQWDEIVRWQRYRVDGERWHGFECVRELAGVPAEVLLVPLVGHTWGHCGVAVQTQAGWLFHAGDAYFHRDEMNEPPRCTPGLAAYQTLMEVDRERRLANQQRLRELKRAHGDAVTVFSAHDPIELARLQATPATPQHAIA